MNKKQVAKKFQDCLRYSKGGLSAQWTNTDNCRAFYSGDSMNYEGQIQYSVGSQKKRAMVRFNKVMPFVDGVCGFMQQNRRIIKYIARVENSLKQQTYSDYANSVSSYVRDNTGAEFLEGEQDLDMLVCGYGATETDLSYVQGNLTTCPNGEIIKVRLDPRCTFWDASARRKNLKDSRWCGYWADYSLDDALALFPDSEVEDFQDTPDTSDDEEYVYNPYGGRYNKTSLSESLDWASKEENKVRVHNFQWYEIESYWQADNPLQSLGSDNAKLVALEKMAAIQQQEGYEDLFGFDPQANVLTMDLKIKNELVKIFGNLIQPVEFKRKCYYTAVCSGSHVFTFFKSVSQQAFSIQFKTGSYDNTRKIWIGMVNGMMQPQLYYNKALTELMFTIASNSKGGVLIEKGAVEDIQTFEQKYASTTAALVVEEGALSGGKIQPKAQNIPTTGLEGIITLVDSSIAEASGVDKAFLGGGVEGVHSGILYRRRIRQVISTIAKYFDSVSDYQKTQARVDLDFFRIWSQNNDGLEFEALGDDGTYTTSRIAYEKFIPEYGIALQESMETAEDRQEKAEIISSIGDKLAAIDPAAAKVIYGVSLKYLNLDSDDKKKIADAMQPQEQPIDPAYVQQLEENLKILSSETNMADVKRKMAGAEKDMAMIDKIRADTAKTLEDAQQKGIENDLMLTTPVTGNTI
jgi:hypothetical protein